MALYRIPEERSNFAPEGISRIQQADSLEAEIRDDVVDEDLDFGARGEAESEDAIARRGHVLTPGEGEQGYAPAVCGLRRRAGFPSEERANDGGDSLRGQFGDRGFSAFATPAGIANHQFHPTVEMGRHRIENRSGEGHAL